MKSSLRQADVVYSGDVQGVGFRYTVFREASFFDVTGFVENQYDGTVHLVAEGQEEELTKFLNAIRHSRLRGNIQSENLRWASGTGHYASFSIR